MNRRDIFLAEIKRFSQIVDDLANSPSVRIVALCNLYSLRQFDVHEQAKCVSKIKEIAEHCITNDN